MIRKEGGVVKSLIVYIENKKFIYPCVSCVHVRMCKVPVGFYLILVCKIWKPSVWLTFNYFLS